MVARFRPPPNVVPPSRAVRLLDAFADAPHCFAGVAVAPYFALGVVGLMVGFAVSCAVGLARGVPLAFELTLAIASLTAFVLAAWIRRRLIGQERHVLLEDVLVVLGAGAAVARLAHRPVTATLELQILGVGTFLVFGRLGCLAAGCCHGRPARFGITYRRPGAVASPLLGLRLFPIQLVEAGWIALGTAFAFAFAPAAAVWFWLLWYACGRFVFELARGDRRPTWWGLSEAQWLSIALVVARVVVEERRGGGPWVPCAIACVWLVAAIRIAPRWLASASCRVARTNVLAWRRVLDDLERRAQSAPVEATVVSPTGDLRVGLTIDRDDGGWLHSYAVSATTAALDDAEASLLAGLLRERMPDAEIVRHEVDPAGVLHLWARVSRHWTPPPTDHADYVWQRVIGFSLGRS